LLYLILRSSFELNFCEGNAEITHSTQLVRGNASKLALHKDDLMDEELEERKLPKRI